MTKTDRYQEFKQFPHCYEYHYQDADIDLGLDLSKKIILELGCGSGNYTTELAKLHPEYRYIGVDVKSDRLHFGAKRSIEQDIPNTKWLRTQIDHLNHCFPQRCIDEIWITFPDPRPGRDRQKLTSPKYLAIYHSLLKPNGLIHVKTDDKAFFDFSAGSLKSAGYDIIRNIQDLYAEKAKVLKGEDAKMINEELAIQTFYEQQWLKQGRKVYYLEAKAKAKMDLI